MPDGHVPSTGIRLTGICSPRPSNILAVTWRTNSGAVSGTMGGRSNVLLASEGTRTSCNWESVASTALKFCCTTCSPLAA